MPVVSNTVTGKEELLQPHVPVAPTTRKGSFQVEYTDFVNKFRTLRDDLPTVTESETQYNYQPWVPNYSSDEDDTNQVRNTTNPTLECPKTVPVCTKFQTEVFDQDIGNVGVGAFKPAPILNTGQLQDDPIPPTLSCHVDLQEVKPAPTLHVATNGVTCQLQAAHTPTRIGGNVHVVELKPAPNIPVVNDAFTGQLQREDTPPGIPSQVEVAEIKPTAIVSPHTMSNIKVFVSQEIDGGVAGYFVDASLSNY